MEQILMVLTNARSQNITNILTILSTATGRLRYAHGCHWPLYSSHHVIYSIRMSIDRLSSKSLDLMINMLTS